MKRQAPLGKFITFHLGEGWCVDETIVEGEFYLLVRGQGKWYQVKRDQESWSVAAGSKGISERRMLKLLESKKQKVRNISRPLEWYVKKGRLRSLKKGSTIEIMTRDGRWVKVEFMNFIEKTKMVAWRILPGTVLENGAKTGRSFPLYVRRVSE